MKKIIFSMLCLVTVASVNAQSDKYQKAMTANLAKFDSAKTAQDFQTLSASFERIANAEKNQWLPYYYAAQAQIIYGFVKNTPAENDAIAEKAEKWLNTADSLQKDNSEISCLRSMAATLHMMVNPMQRYMQYLPDIEKALAAAKKQDPTNPRPHFIQGQNLKGTPEQFGGGCKTAKPVMQQALALYATFKPSSPLHPNWGKSQAQEIFDGCK